MASPNSTPDIWYSVDNTVVLVESSEDEGKPSSNLLLHSCKATLRRVPLNMQREVLVINQ